LREGRKRQIRETGNLIGLPVVKIIRVRIGPVQIGNLKPKEWRVLAPQEVAALKGKVEKPINSAKPGIPKKRKEPGKPGGLNKSTKAVKPERSDKSFNAGKQNKTRNPPVKRRSEG
jgi:23S rRNA pseudouridine2605 synthase